MCSNLKYFCLNIILLCSSTIVLALSCAIQALEYRERLPYNDTKFILGFILIGFSVVGLFFEIIQYLRMWKKKRKVEIWGEH